MSVFIDKRKSRGLKKRYCYINVYYIYIRKMSYNFYLFVGKTKIWSCLKSYQPLTRIVTFCVFLAKKCPVLNLVNVVFNLAVSTYSPLWFEMALQYNWFSSVE